MSRRDALLLRLAAGWTFFVWAVFVKNQIGSDNSFGFKAIHFVIALVSVLFGAITWQVASRSRRRDRSN